MTAAGTGIHPGRAVEVWLPGPDGRAVQEFDSEVFDLLDGGLLRTGHPATAPRRGRHLDGRTGGASAVTAV
ncbi:hypothetical protein ACIQCJ_17075 [Streptomyces sp. NPDC093221]|uniref:hypothetical protein n=1 Tax=Streptomyces sp. NPDC093221 TaxID=3366032 RepID=UPI0037F99E73